ncbi:helix-turn-helix transcriptional regulator [Sphingomonas sp. CJ20]
MSEHVHDAPSLCILISGGYEENIRGRQDAYLAGNLSFCPAHAPHSQSIGRAGAAKLLLTPTRSGLELLSAHAQLDDAPAFHAEAVATIGRRMVAEMSIDDPFSEIAIEGLGYELVAIFARSTAQRQDTPARWLRDACDYMAAHACEARSLGEIAAAVGCDPVRLSRGFRRAHGHSIGEHQRKLRVSAASELLATTPMPLAEIAQACGFYDQAHLTRSFKAVVGCTPAVFRKGL